MINIYNSKETNFKHNGLAVLDSCIRCEVEEELNKYYGLELEYPIFSNKAKYLIEDNIIKAPTPTGLQLFRIYRKVKNMSTITVYGRHIFYDLLDNFIESYRTGNVSGNGALKGILNNLQYKTNFKSYSNISTIADAYYVRKNPVEILIGEEKNSFLNRWGGELKRDNFSISILNSIGENNGVAIRYGKNLIGIEEDLDISEVVTRIMPTGLDDKDNSVILPEKYIDSPLINKYPKAKVRHLHFGDIKVNSEENITLNDVYKLLREKVQELYQIQQIDIPNVNYTVDFVELSKTEEYKNYKVLETVHLGDVILVKHKKLGIDIKQKVIKYRWDSILGKYLEIELGNFKENLSADINNLSNSIEEVKEDMQETKKQTTAKFEVTDDKIGMNVEEIGKTKAQLELTANEIRAEVNNEVDNLYSKISITADKIESKVERVDDRLSSRITQQADRIDMVVDGNGDIRAAQIALSISESGSAIELISDHIYIRPHDGVVHFPNGSDIDTRNGRLRLRYSSNEYLAIGDDFDFYMNGRILASITSSGIYHNGERLAKMSDIPRIPQG
ncbi:phage tail spike protein [Clostridium tetani]|uniref:phage tail spike protein n=1 Tax=Clostridium tetani TaxID=1513 RepID=UPI00100AA388|nr:phage tail spike protein [Clostridium tetani]RXM57219.1 endopeptidase [Clostridium tetani]